MSPIGGEGRSPGHPGSAQSRGSAALSPPETTFLLTNDDGWDAPGLAALWQAAEGLGRCRLVAPSRPGLRVRAPGDDPRRSRSRRLGEDRVAVAGRRPIASGWRSITSRRAWIGSSPGSTPAATWVRTSTIRGRSPPSGRGCSTACRGSPCRTTSPAAGSSIGLARRGGPARVLRQLLAMPPEPGTFWNVNFPHPGPDEPEPDIVFCPLDPRPCP